MTRPPASPVYLPEEPLREIIAPHLRRAEFAARDQRRRNMRAAGAH